MGRPKKNKEQTHVDIHNHMVQTSFRKVNSACSDSELRDVLLITINGYLQHIDRCISELTDLQKGGNANAKSASRADDAREV